MRQTLALAMAMGIALSACAHPYVPLMPRHPDMARSEVAMGDWHLQRTRNPFSEAVTCRLWARKSKAFYQAGAVAFRFPKGWDVHEAVYRIDGGAIQSWRNDLPELVRIGAPIDQGSVINATAGLVWIPWSKLADANRIAIQARPDRLARIFHFSGLKGLYDTAVVEGCAPDSRFVR